MLVSEINNMGADLVGFCVDDQGVRFVFGEVKTSSEKRYPPQVMMSGSASMKQQLNRLVADLSIVTTLIKWLRFRCLDSDSKLLFNQAMMTFLQSGNKAVSLFGVLVRDTEPNELDMRGCGLALESALEKPMSCNLIALYVPCQIAELGGKVKGVSVS